MPFEKASMVQKNLKILMQGLRNYENTLNCYLYVLNYFENIIKYKHNYKCVNIEILNEI